MDDGRVVRTYDRNAECAEANLKQKWYARKLHERCIRLISGSALSIYSRYYPPPLHRQYVTDEGTVGIALAALLFLCAGSSLSRQQGIASASSLFLQMLQGARQDA